MSKSDKAAIEELVRIAGSQRRLAESLGAKEATVSRWVKGVRTVPSFVPLLVELLNKLPRENWPERWK